MGTLFERSILRALTAFAVGLVLSSSSYATTSDFFNVTPETPAHAVHTNTDLSQIFQTGSGPYSPTMAGKIYPYPMTKNGVAGAPLYNGCYDRKGKRLHDLDPDNSCATTIQANPGIAIFRLFVGYKVDCADSPFVAPTCKDMRLLMNCQYAQVQTGTGAFENATAPIRECSAEHGIVRKANANSVTLPAQTGCYPGTDGTTYPTCTACAPGTFNSNYSPNKVVCTKCSDVMTVAHRDTSGPAINDSDWISSRNLDGSSPMSGGSESQGDCKLKKSLPWQCEPNYQKDPYEQGCVLSPPQCTLGMAMTQVSPTGTSNDGSLTINVNGAQGSLVQFAITAPTTNSGSGTGTQKTFSGLAAGAYTVTAQDSVCTQSNTYTLTAAPPSPSPTPSPTSTSGCLHILNVVQPTTSTSTDGKFDVHVDGAGTFSFNISPNPSAVMTQTVPSPSVMSGNFTYSSLGSGPYTVTSTGTCADSQNVNLAPPLSPSCTLAFSLTGTNPSSSTATDGGLSGTTTGAVGTVTYTLSPAGGTVTTQTNTAYGVSGLGNGTYTVTATDAGVPSCSITKTTTLSGGAPVCPICPVGSIWDYDRQNCYIQEKATKVSATYCDYTCGTYGYTTTTTCQGSSYTDPVHGTCTQTGGPTSRWEFQCPAGYNADFLEDCVTSPTKTVNPECPTGSTWDGTNCTTATISCGSQKCDYSCSGAGHCQGSACAVTAQACIVNTGSYFIPWAGQCNTTQGPHSASNCCPLGFTFDGTKCIAPKSCDTTPRPGGGGSGDITEVYNAGTVGSTRNQKETVNLVVVGRVYYCEVYSHMAWTVATVGDTTTTLAAKIAAAVNATTLTEWDDHNSDFTSYKPSATSSGSTVTLTLNYQNQFGCGSLYY